MTICLCLRLNKFVDAKISEQYLVIKKHNIIFVAYLHSQKHTI